MVQESDVVNPAISSRSLDVVNQVCTQMGCVSDGLKTTISPKARREKALISLWQWLDIDDFSTAKFFIVPEDPYVDTKAVFLVDFLSRHEIIPPMTKENLPQGWEEWGAAKGNNILVCNKGIFLKKLMTPDIFLALPPHRFQALADDIEQMVSDGSGIIEAIRKTLSQGGTGYSFVLFLGQKGSCSMDVSVVWSCLNGEIYENPSLFRSASQ